jgi:nitrilase
LPKSKPAGHPTASRRVRVAIAQSSAVYLNAKASLAKALHFAEQAARSGARLVAMGETWLPGYPAWLDYCPDAALWDHPPVKRVFAALRQNSIVVPGVETEALARAAKTLAISIVIGVNERVDAGPGNGTLYNSLLTFTPQDGLVNLHRKLVPTYSERMIWGPGDGRGLTAVDTPAGRVGGLICWEHWMPLARQAMHDSGESIHVAVWPTVHEIHQLASRHYAFEGRCFVLAVGVIMPAADVPAGLASPKGKKKPDLLLRGGSAVIAPDGRYVVPPLLDRETLMVADLDLAETDQGKMTLDVSGHYARPDVFSFRIRTGGD